MDETTKKRPWLVRIHYQMRAVSFALLFAATTLHSLGRDYGPAVWVLLILLLLLYPHLQYWRACRAADPVRAEMSSLLVDSVLLGVFAAIVEFSVWLSFSSLLGTLTNNAANKGWRGVWAPLAAYLGGALLGVLVGGWRFAPETGWPATLFCIVGLSGYLLAIGNLGFTRNLQLRSTREALKGREAQLLKANETLRESLEEINALQQQLREQAVRDPLTGLYNRRYLDHTLARELARCKREGQVLSLIMIDIDLFKKINDTFGHQAGDEVLRRLGATLGTTARAGDIACRYGGEEFLLVMPTMPLSKARQRAEDLRLEFGAMIVPFGSFRFQATLSIGVAAYPGHGTSVDELIRCADAALYQAKQNGRNLVCVAPAAIMPAALEDDSIAHLVQIVWHHAYDSGNVVIDDQHRALFTHVNLLFSAFLGQRPADEVSALLDRLVNDIVEHFRDEELLIAAAGYPDVAGHIAIHAELIERTVQLVDRFYAGDATLGEVFRFLAHEVVVRHMLGDDRAFFPYLESLHGDAYPHPVASLPAASAEPD